jgi:hypothetical protein
MEGCMTLAERRVVHDFETNQMPALSARVTKTAGFDVPLEVSWDTLAVPGESHLYAESWPVIYFEPLIGALQIVGRDEMGRNALQSALKKIIIRNSKGCAYGDCWATFLEGILTLDHESVTNAYDVDGRTKGLVRVLENGL